MDRLKNVQKSRKAIRAKYGRLAKKMIKNEGVKISEEDESDIRMMMDDLTPEVRTKYGKDSPQHVLWQEQKKYNSLKNKRQMRWHPLVIRFALSLFYSSRVAYRTATSSGFLALPSERTLTGYKLFPMVWDVIESLELSDLPVVAVTVDGASHNRHFFRLCCLKDDGTKSSTPFVTRNPFAERDVYFFCDPPHLIKTTRNCFSNSCAHKMSRELKVHKLSIMF